LGAGEKGVSPGSKAKVSGNGKDKGNGKGVVAVMGQWYPTHDDETVMYGAPELLERVGGEQATATADSSLRCGMTNKEQATAKGNDKSK
jgi:hypothetical protein